MDGKLNWLQKNGYDLARKIGKVAVDSGGWKPRVAAIPSKRQGEGELTCGCEAGSVTRRLYLNHHSPGGLHLGREAAECVPAPRKAHSCPDPLALWSSGSRMETLNVFHYHVQQQ